ncbi:MAG: DinB family protein [Firmicutes bacterium]|nr:DinB family protein [Bacillota bacterium]
MAAIEVSAEVAANSSAIAFAFALPGACGWGPSLEAALERLRWDVHWEVHWLERHELASPVTSADAPFAVDETVAATGDPLKCDTEGFYRIDRQPLLPQQVGETLRLVGTAYRDITAVVSSLSEEQWTLPVAAGKRSPGQIVSHVAIAAWWYMTRIPGAPAIQHWREWPSAPLEQVSVSQQVAARVLRELGEREVQAAQHVLDGETWSARKVVRRLVWHGLWHLKELRRYLCY